MGINVRSPQGSGPARVAGLIDRLVRWLAQHWLATFNAIVALFIALPFLAPLLAQLGAEGPARLIYTLYAPTCHQLPERSFFLFGEQAVYDVHELEAAGALPPGLNIFQRQALRFNGMAGVGYKVAICQRDIAIYGAILITGLLFGALRGRLQGQGNTFPKMPLWLFGLLLVPLFIDGATQLFGLRESNWWLRLVTGGLFGAAVVWLAYPYVQEAMADVLNPPRESKTESRKLSSLEPMSGGRQTGQKPPSGV